MAMLSCWGSVSVADGCSWISGDVSCRVASVVRLYLAAVLAQPEMFPEPRLSPRSPCQDWRWEGDSRAVSLHRAGSWHSTGTPAAVALDGGCMKGTGVPEKQLVGSCGSSAVRWKGAVSGGQSAQRCTPGPMSSSPGHCYLNLEALHEKKP